MPALVHPSISERISGGQLVVNLDALMRNWQFLNNKSGKAEAAAVVKADGYGLGIEPVVQALSQAGCKRFFVSFLDEGIKVRKQAPNAEIFVFNGLIPHSEAYYVESNLTPVLCSIEDVERWSTHTRLAGSRRPCAIHLDTGINRMGLTIADIEQFIADAEKRFSITPIMLMSHLACADDPQDPMNNQQLQRFLACSNLISGVDLSLANSAGIMMGEDFHFSITRPGISLYGGECINGVPALETVATLQGRIMQVRHASAGETVGYGATGKLDRDSRIAVVAVGYADGYHRGISGHGVPLRNAVADGGYGAIAGYRVPIVGRVSMDMTVFDLTDVPEHLIHTHDWIELFGETIKLDDAARQAGTIGYEMLTSIGNRFHRKYYIGEDKPAGNNP